MRTWDATRVAAAAGARLHERAGGEPPPGGPERVVIDSRQAVAGALFVGLAGERADGGAYAADALSAGAWGALVAPAHAQAAAAAGGRGVVLLHDDPLAGLQALAGAWRRELGAAGMRVVAITGSTGKTSTKDILAVLLAPHARIVASPENLNTEIGLPLAITAAAPDTEVLVLEMAMRGAGQIAELTAIARPDVGVIVNVGPVHLELLGSLEAIAAAKAELIAGMPDHGSVVVPAGEALLQPYLRNELHTVTFGPGGEVELIAPEPGRAAGSAARDAAGAGDTVAAGDNVAARDTVAAGDTVAIRAGERTIVLRPSFTQAHNVRNLLAAVAAALALGIEPAGDVAVSFSRLRGEWLSLPGGAVLINDCYNANPMSMAAAIDDLAQTSSGRRLAVLGDMLELGPRTLEFHRAVGEHAAAQGIEVLVTVGDLAAAMAEGFSGEAHSVSDARAAGELLPRLLRDGDTVLVKGSRGVGLERVAEALGARVGDASSAVTPQGAGRGAPQGGPIAAARGPR